MSRRRDCEAIRILITWPLLAMGALAGLLAACTMAAAPPPEPASVADAPAAAIVPRPYRPRFDSTGVSRADTNPVRDLEAAPSAESYVAAGMRGIYDELRAAESRQKGEKLDRPRRPSLQLAPHVRYESHDTPPNPSAYNIRQIVIKFVEGSAVRLRRGKLQRVAEPEATETAARLARAGLEPAAVLRDLEIANRTAVGASAVFGRAAPQVDEHDLVLLRRRAESNARSEMADLNLFYFMHLPAMDGEHAARILLRLRSLPAVELAYFQPIPYDAADIPPITVIDVTPSQGYFMGPPAGIDVNFARNLTGGRGNAIRIADIEGGWHLVHEDHPPPSFGFGVNFGNSHGTAVLGELIAEENGFGGNGIAPNAEFGWSSVTNLDPANGIYFYSVGNALLTAAKALRPGDIALIEQQSEHIFDGFICNVANDPCGNCNLPHYVAIEEFANEHAVIRQLTSVGVVIVEAAGNGRTPVTPASAADSGAIVVGAGDLSLGPMCWSNFGPRVNVQAWGTAVGTSGYGQLQANGNDPAQWYTTGFGGTSSASPIVAGAAAIVQGTRLAAGLSLLTSIEMRDLLVATGTPQAPTPPGTTLRNIGPQPDLRRAIASYLPDRARFVRHTPVPAVVAPGSVFMRTVTFANSGGISWSGGHSMAIAPQGTAAQPGFSALAFPVGSTGFPIDPNREIARTFNIVAPMQPGTYNLSTVLRNAGGNVMASSPAQQIVVSPPGPIDDASIDVLSAPGSLPTGLMQPVILRVTNTGTTTWTAANYSLRLQRGLKVSLLANSVALPANVTPGAVQILAFVVQCNAPGQGYYTAQMTGTGPSFGQVASATVACTPAP